VPVDALLEVALPAPPAPVALLDVAPPPLVVAVVEPVVLVAPPAPVVVDVPVSPPLQAAKPTASVTSPRTTAA
jgi:hypothetical protein